MQEYKSVTGGFSQYTAVYLYIHLTMLAFFPSSCTMR